MKSSPRAVIRDGDFKPALWQPDDFQEESVQAKSKFEDKKELLQAIFAKVSDGKVEKKEKRSVSALYPAESGRDFGAWQPGSMDWQPPFHGHEAWSFLETLKDLQPTRYVKEITEERTSEYQTPEEFDAEKTAGEIIRKARADADEIILEAQKNAESVLQQTQEEIEAEKAEFENHRDELFQQLRDQAYQQGVLEAHAEFESGLKAIRELVEEVRVWQEALTSQGEHILADMAKEMAQAMFGEGVRLDANALQINLNRIIDNAQGMGELNIFLNPRDARLLDPSWAEYQLLISGERVKIIPSENITVGGCFVKGSVGTVDARVETQLASILNTVEENKKPEQ